MHLDDDLRKSLTEFKLLLPIDEIRLDGLRHIGFVFRRGVHVHVLMFVDDRLLSKRKKSNFAGSRLPKTATCLISTAEPAE